MRQKESLDIGPLLDADGNGSLRPDTQDTLDTPEDTFEFRLITTGGALLTCATQAPGGGSIQQQGP